MLAYVLSKYGSEIGLQNQWQYYKITSLQNHHCNSQHPPSVKPRQTSIEIGGFGGGGGEFFLPLACGEMRVRELMGEGENLLTQ